MEQFALDALQFLKELYRDLYNIHDDDRTFLERKCFNKAKEMLSKAGFIDENGKLK